MRTIFLFLVLLSFSTVNAQQNILVPYRTGDKWGYSDTTGHIKIQPRFDSAEPFAYNEYSSPDQAYAIVTAAGMKSVINLQGKEILTGKYEEIEINYLVNGVSFIVQNAQGKRGVYSPAKQIIPVVHDVLYSARNDSYIVSKDDKKGLVNGEGKLLLSVEYDDISESHEGDEANFEWNAEKDGVLKTIKDKRMLPKQSGAFTPPRIVADEEVYPETDTNWKQKLANKWRADSIVLADLEGHNSLWILYRKNQQAIFFDYDIPGELSFFDAAFSIRNAYQMYKGMPDHDQYKARFLIHVNKNGKEGLITEKNQVVVAPELDVINYKEEFASFELVKDGKMGIYTVNTVYPYIKPKYDHINKKHSIYVDSSWQFGIYQVARNDKTFYVGENGVEFFRE